MIRTFAYRWSCNGCGRSRCHDELVEVTPTAIRLRKRVLAANQRPKRRRGRVAFGPDRFKPPQGDRHPRL